MQYPLVADAIVTFLKEYLLESGTKGVVIGLSGGIDSAVVAVLCRKALGEEKVQCIFFKDAHTPGADYIDICRLLTKFPMRCETIEIADMVKAMSFTDDKVINGNLRSRIRMSLLYQCANMHNYLVVGTTNKTELLLGYFTKYGDGGVDIEPIGDLYKTDVKKLAEYLELPEEIIRKPPSAGFWVGQTDEEELGMEYSLIDKILQNKTHPLEMSKTITDLVAKNEHKRTLPSIPKIIQ